MSNYALHTGSPTLSTHDNDPAPSWLTSSNALPLQVPAMMRFAAHLTFELQIPFPVHHTHAPACVRACTLLPPTPAARFCTMPGNMPRYHATCISLRTCSQPSNVGAPAQRSDACRHASLFQRFQGDQLATHAPKLGRMHTMSLPLFSGRLACWMAACGGEEQRGEQRAPDIKSSQGP